jgi:hypothetical protein
MKRAKKREPLGEAGLMEYAVRALASKMRGRPRGPRVSARWMRWWRG